MHWNNKLLKNLNIYIPLVVLLLIAIGFIAISSAVEVNKPDSQGLIFLKKQAVSVVLGILGVLILQFYDYSVFKHYYEMIFLGIIGILTFILIFGETVAGGKRWLMIGPVNFQPSELAKIMMILVFAAIMDQGDELKHLSGFLKPFLFLIIPFALIIMQNDLGTALVLLVIFVIMLFSGGGNFKFIALVFGGGFLLILLIILAHEFIGTPLPLLKDYQLDRLVVFINPNVDPQGIGYNIIQSRIAVGSGQLYGKGLFAGTQNQLNFLPEKHTDFIFSVIGEEFGFIGVIIVLGAYFYLLWEILKIAAQARDNYGRLIVIGIWAMLFFHVLENVGMTMGVMPITGIPLPFISYGGSSMVSNLLAIGLVINVNMRKKKIIF